MTFTDRRRGRGGQAKKERPMAGDKTVRYSREWKPGQEKWPSSQRHLSLDDVRSFLKSPRPSLELLLLFGLSLLRSTAMAAREQCQSRAREEGAKLTWPGDGQSALSAMQVSFYIGAAAVIIGVWVLSLGAQCRLLSEKRVSRSLIDVISPFTHRQRPYRLAPALPSNPCADREVRDRLFYLSVQFESQGDLSEEQPRSQGSRGKHAVPTLRGGGHHCRPADVGK
jgi:hypothetical protein